MIFRDRSTYTQFRGQFTYSFTGLLSQAPHSHNFLNPFCFLRTYIFVLWIQIRTSVISFFYILPVTTLMSGATWWKEKKNFKRPWNFILLPCSHTSSEEKFSHLSEFQAPVRSHSGHCHCYQRQHRTAQGLQNVRDSNFEHARNPFPLSQIQTRGLL